MLTATSSFPLSLLLFPSEAIGQEATQTQHTDRHKHQHSAEPATEVFVTGSLAPRPLDSYTLPYTLLSTEEIRSKFGGTIAAALEDEAGIRSSSFVPGAARPIVRGQGGSRVRVLNNGVTLGDVSALSDDHAVPVDPNSASRIEVVRGPSTLLYGGSAIGGVVNVIDGSIPETRIGREFTGSATVNQGNVADRLTAGSAELMGEADAVQWYVSSFYRDTGNIKIPGYAESDRYRAAEEAEENGEEHEEGHAGEHEGEHGGEEVRDSLPNSDTMARGVTVGVSNVHDNGFFGGSIKLFETKYGVPGHAHAGHAHGEEEDHEDHEDHEHDAEDADHSEHEGHMEDESVAEPAVAINLTQARATFKGESTDVASGIEKLKVNGVLSTYEHNELEGESVGTRFRNDAIETRFELVHDPMAFAGNDEGMTGGGGLQILADSFRVDGEEAYLPDANTVAPALFLVEELALNESLKWQNGARYEWSSVDPSSASDGRNLDQQNHSLVSGSTGLSSDFGKSNYTLSSTVAYTERAPTNAELFADGVHTATRTFEIGDESLAKERSIGGEITLRRTKGRLTGSVTSFIQHYDDYINLAPTGEIDEGTAVFVYEMTRAQLWGGEIEGELHLFEVAGNSVDLVASSDLVRGRDLGADGDLPRMPPTVTRAGFHYDYEDIHAELMGTYSDAQKRVAAFELPTNSYLTVDLEASYKFPWERNELTTFVRLSNLTDEEVRNAVSFTKDQFPQTGRAVYAGLTAAF